MKKKIILASGSKRRKDLLTKAKVVFEVYPANYEEDMTLKLLPRELVAHLSLGKASAVARVHERAIIIAADTVVVLGSELLGKPKDYADAKAMLQKLSGKKHTVFTGYVILDSESGKKVSRVVETAVYFKSLSKTAIDVYVASGSPLDKAGSYGIQDEAAQFVEKIEGDYHNVIGLPIASLLEDLKKFEC